MPARALSTLLIALPLFLGLLMAATCAQEPTPESPTPESPTPESPTPESPAPESSGLSQVGSLIEFSRDIQPILQARCLACHGPDEAKNDFRVDDAESVLGYLEPGDIENSLLWTDYLITDDSEVRMPPVDAEEAKALTGAELAAIKLWIEEGAKWSETKVETDASPVIEATPSLAARIWSFQGLFHPASVHFPIALLTLSGVFVLFSYFNRESFEPAAFHCLWIGTAGAIVSCVMGWAYSQHEGYGAGYSFDLSHSAIDRHRWLGIGVAVLASLLILIASSVRRHRKSRMRVLWLLGSFVLAGAVTMTGYQGGELTFGEDHYAKEFERLFPSQLQAESKEELGNVVSEASQSPSADEASVEPQPKDPK